MKTKHIFINNKLIGICAIILGVVLSSIGFQGCEKDEIDYKLAIPDQYQEVGKLHNQGLDHIFSAIKNSHIENMKETDITLKNALAIDYNAIITEATLDFSKSNKRLKNDYEVCKSIIGSTHNLKSAKIETDLLNEFNSKQIELTKEIVNVMKIGFSNENLKKLKSDLDNINNKALKNLSESEAIPIYCATSTAYATFQYWQKNFKKWYFALNYPEILTKYNEDQLNNLSVKNETLKLKSTSDEEPWYKRAWTSVENWWIEGTSKEEMDWLYQTLEEMGEADVLGAIAGQKWASFTGAVTVSCYLSALKGADELLDKYDE